MTVAAAKSLQSCPTLCDPTDGSPPGSTVPGILQARTLEWVAIAFSSSRKWKVKVKSLSCVRLLATPWTAAYQAPPSVGFSRQECWRGCHRLLRVLCIRHFLSPLSTLIHCSLYMYVYTSLVASSFLSLILKISQLPQKTLLISGSNFKESLHFEIICLGYTNFVGPILKVNTRWQHSYIVQFSQDSFWPWQMLRASKWDCMIL